MDEKNLLAQLKRIRIAVDSAIRELSSIEEKTVVGTCLYCGKDVFEGDKLFRKVHSSCYHEILRAQDRGEVTFDQLVAAGRLGKAGSPGRKRKNRAREIVEQMKREADQGKADEVIEEGEEKIRKSRGKKVTEKGKGE